MDRVRTARPHIALASAVALAIAATMPFTLPADPVDAAGAKACVVKNTKRGGTYGSLAAAIKRARNKDKLTVRGICPGRTKVSNKKLTIVGVRTKTSGPPTLKGTGKGPVLWIEGDFANVTIKKLVVKGKAAQVLDFDGGGFFNNNSKLTLQHVTVKEFKTTGRGGGIHNLEGTVRLLGVTKVQGNKGVGAGIYNNSGTVVLSGSSSVKRNKGIGIKTEGKFGEVHLRWSASVKDNTAGGVWAGYGAVTMTGNSTIRGNAAEDGAGYRGSGALTMNNNSSITGNTATFEGGGVLTAGTVTMTDASSITGNTAGIQGGGLYAFSEATLVGVVCDTGSGGKVSGNSPDDCYFD